MQVGDAMLPNQPDSARNYFLACYAVYLIQGNTINGKFIRHKTVKNYTDDAILLMRARRLSHACDEDYLKIILDTHRKYESIPNRRHMITDEMMVWLVKTASVAHRDSHLAAIVDWTLLGRYTGFRKSEWCQSTQSKFDKITGWHGAPSQAFIRSDFVFLGARKQIIPDPLSVHPSCIKYIHIRWRWQKNGQHGEVIPFACDYTRPAYCPVMAALRIYSRSIRLRTPSTVPLGVFSPSGTSRFRFITDTQVASLLRSAATAVHNVSKTDPDLKLWSCHSIRVTAANLLHRARFTDSFIQPRLRWRSTSFLMYLRNTTYAAEDHSTALNISCNNLPPPAEHSYRDHEPHESLFLPTPAA